jgi:hypothetical protein
MPDLGHFEPEGYLHRSRFWDSVNGRILLAIVVCIPLTNLLFSPLTCALGWYVIESHQLLQPNNPNFWRVVLGSPSAKRLCHSLPGRSSNDIAFHHVRSGRAVSSILCATVACLARLPPYSVVRYRTSPSAEPHWALAPSEGKASTRREQA